ncbi:MAG: hypothetical protein DMG49_02005 [Acidobacteria bacterium]|nr:MAG: hypothetical protein DMG49_02005 [Acidobacteriota bacterium]
MTRLPMAKGYAPTRDVDHLMLEIASLVRQRESNVAGYESKLADLGRRENEQKEKIVTLERVPFKAIRHFAEALMREDRRSAIRDYILFGLGVIVITVVALGLKWLGYWSASLLDTCCPAAR